MEGTDWMIAHCLDSLRQSIQCYGDVSLLTMRWYKGSLLPVGNFSSPHECVNFDAIQDWAKDYTMDMLAPGVLVHPTLGPSFPNGTSTSRLGVIAKVDGDD